MSKTYDNSILKKAVQSAAWHAAFLGLSGSRARTFALTPCFPPKTYALSPIIWIALTKAPPAGTPREGTQENRNVHRLPAVNPKAFNQQEFGDLRSLQGTSPGDAGLALESLDVSLAPKHRALVIRHSRRRSTRTSEPR